MRLAARLTGYKIDIKPESQVEFVEENNSTDTDEIVDSEETAEVENSDNQQEVVEEADTLTNESESKE